MMLEDKKTYIVAGVAGLVTVFYGLGWIEQSTWQVLMGLLVPAAAATLKSGQIAQTAKVMAKVEAVEKPCPPEVK